MESLSKNHDIQKIIFEPSEEVRGLIVENSQNDFRKDLSQIPPKTNLYKVIGISKQGARIVIGHIETSSSIIASRYGDYRLFFQHHR